MKLIVTIKALLITLSFVNSVLAQDKSNTLREETNIVDTLRQSGGSSSILSPTQFGERQVYSNTKMDEILAKDPSIKSFSVGSTGVLKYKNAENIITELVFDLNQYEQINDRLPDELTSNVESITFDRNDETYLLLNTGLRDHYYLNYFEEVDNDLLLTFKCDLSSVIDVIIKQYDSQNNIISGNIIQVSNYYDGLDDYRINSLPATARVLISFILPPSSSIKVSELSIKKVYMGKEE